MYGLVNDSLSQYVTTRFGADTLQAVREQAGVAAHERFVSTSRYPDAVTYQMVGALSTISGIDGATLLDEFGQFWVGCVERGPYGGLLRLYGRTLREFLGNLDNMHAQISVTLPQIDAPSFRCSRVTGTSLVLHYHSSRDGLAPFVIGLLKGLATFYETPVQVSQIATKGHGSDHDQFHVEFATAA
jgi:Haem-NO-binding